MCYISPDCLTVQGLPAVWGLGVSGGGLIWASGYSWWVKEADNDPAFQWDIYIYNYIYMWIYQICWYLFWAFIMVYRGLSWFIWVAGDPSTHSQGSKKQWATTMEAMKRDAWRVWRDGISPRTVGSIRNQNNFQIFSLHLDMNMGITVATKKNEGFYSLEWWYFELWSHSQTAN